MVAVLEDGFSALRMRCVGNIGGCIEINAAGNTPKEMPMSLGVS